MCLTAFGKHLQLLPLPQLITLGYLSLQVMMTHSYRLSDTSGANAARCRQATTRLTDPAH